MDTKLKGYIAEYSVIVYTLKKGWGVSKPVGDRLPYDLILDVNHRLVRIQIKSAWWDAVKQNYVVDNRRTKTNRRQMVREPYGSTDFDFAVIHVPDIEVFYVFPCSVFIQYGSEIHLVETDKRQRKPVSSAYRNAWELIEQWAA